MKLPSNYLDVVARGVITLRNLATQMRQLADRRPDAPELWLSVRDYESLGQRLAESSEWEWQHGIADMQITSLDFAALTELLTASTRPLKLSHEDSSAIAHLSDFLHRYCKREFELEDPAA